MLKKSEEMKRKVEVHTKIVGMRYMCISYLNHQKARPVSDYGDVIAINVQGEIDMGNINHSV